MTKQSQQDQDTTAKSQAPVPKACVIGWPISHSRSPLIHGYWLAHHGLAGSYGKEAVRPEDLRVFLRSLRARGFVGCNVTVPHKEAAFGLADIKEKSATAVGAANTLWLEGDRLHAANTDGVGFMTHLRQAVPGWDAAAGAASVLGAGGAARAVVYALLSAGVQEVRLFNRTKARALELTARFSDEFAGRLRVLPWEARAQNSDDAALVVNTTSLGMTGAPALEFDSSVLPGDAVVADIVYAPLETALLRHARMRGLRTVDGLGMLLHQAAPGFEKWFGLRPEVTGDLRNVIVADITRAR